MVRTFHVLLVVLCLASHARAELIGHWTFDAAEKGTVPNSGSGGADLAGRFGGNRDVAFDRRVRRAADAAGHPHGTDYDQRPSVTRLGRDSPRRHDSFPTQASLPQPAAWNKTGYKPTRPNSNKLNTPVLTPLTFQSWKEDYASH